MKKPSHALTDLMLSSSDKSAPVLPGSFLGGFAARLRLLLLVAIPFPALWKLLLSTHDLVTLHLWRIPRSGYISPQAMATSLSALTKLETLSLKFRSPRACAGREPRRPPPLTRIVLPSLTFLQFKDDSEDLEDIASRIDTSLLDQVEITFFNQLVFDIPLLCTTSSGVQNNLRHPIEQVRSLVLTTSVTHFLRRGMADDRALTLGVACKALDWQLSSLAQVCGSFLSPLPALERLEVRKYRPDWQDDIENTQWLELLPR